MSRFPSRFPSRFVRWQGPLVAVGLVLTWFVLSATVFDPGFIFHGDHERDLRYVTVWAWHGEFPAASPAIAPYPFELGPLSYFVLYPAVALSADPLVVRYWVWLLSACASLLFFDLLRRRTGSLAANIALFGWLSSTFVYEMSRQLWHSSLLPLPVALILWTGARLLERPTRRDAIGCAVAAAVAVQLHLTASVFTLLALGLAILRARALGWRTIALATGAYLVALSPMLFAFQRSVQRGALEALDRPGGPPWSPAGPGELFEFFVDNVHTIWGDNIGPWLTWPFLALMLAGLVSAFRPGSVDGRRPLVDRFLVANLLLGFVVESLLLGNQRAHRYMHANLMSAFALSGFGAHALVGWIRDRLSAGTRAPTVAAVGASLIGVVVVVEAAVSPIPHYEPAGWLTAHEQRAVARALAEVMPVEAEEAERRYHGIFFGETMGLGHYHHITPRSESNAPTGHDEAGLVLPTDLDLPPHGRVVSRTAVGDLRTIDVMRIASHFDYEAMLYRSPDYEALTSRWRRQKGQKSGRSPSVHDLKVPNAAAGVATLALADGRRAEDQCQVAAWLDGEPVRIDAVERPEYTGARFLRLHLTGPGELMIRLGPCQVPTWWDLW